jgi:hypothetical protein
MTDEQIIAIRKASKCRDPAQQWGDTLAFGLAIRAAALEEAAQALENSDAAADGGLPFALANLIRALKDQ